VSPPLPASFTIVDLADWMEMSALQAADKNSSGGDLAAAVGRSAVIDDEKIDALISATLGELAFRVQAAGGGYPFNFNGAVLELHPSAWRHRSTYLLCLSLTRFGFPTNKGRTVFPERMFEEVSAAAAASYLSGQGVRFGHPRKGAPFPSSFFKAVDMMCGAGILAEGQGFSGRHRSWTGDDGLDVVAWRDHGDGRSSKMVLFGACATGGDWEEKVYELQVKQFLELWLQRALDSQFVKAFFVPFRLADRRGDEWSTLAVRAGIPFDRCRIARWAPTLPVTPIHGDTAAWARENLTK
jgi:hypothetical protein